ncbi:MAG: ATP-binding cassette domain-containing protein, partial [Bacteroidales bacterium]|nr:ATP-binding cassette domain-containing protein [Bacteroidales bacterium]
LMETHDRYFLDHVCNRIVELADKTLYTYKGNYAYYLEKRQERITVQNANVDRANNLLRTELDWMRRQPQARAHKSRSRIEAFYELEERAKRRHEQQEMRLQMKSSYIGNKIFEAHHVSKSFTTDKDGHAMAEKVILKDYNYTFARYEKMGIVGHNGTGKSTYLKLLQGLIQPDSGTIDVGETVRFGYYSQEGLQFDEQKKVIDIVRDIADYVMLSDGTKLTASQFLQNFLFSPEKQYSYVYKLSGGEKRRLYLCTILMRSPNFLILDEPTNDLDIVTLNVLEEFLQNFGGCVIVVSHDRYFMDKVVDHLLVFHGQGKLQDYPGNYTDWREYSLLKQQEEEEKKNPKLAVAAGTVSADTRVKPRTEKAPKLSFKEKQEFAALEQELPALEAEKAELEALMSSGTLSGPEIVEKGQRMQEIIDLIDEKEMRWLELSEKQNP